MVRHRRDACDIVITTLPELLHQDRRFRVQLLFIPLSSPPGLVGSSETSGGKGRVRDITSGDAERERVAAEEKPPPNAWGEVEADDWCGEP